MRKIILSSMSAAVLGAAALATAPVQAMPMAHLTGVSSGDDLVTAVQWRGRHWGGGPRYYGGGGYYGHRNNVGPAIGAGVLGLATGAIIGGALAQPRTYGPGYQTYYEPGYQTYYEPGYTGSVVQASPEQDVAYCMQRFKSYDPGSGTYLGYDGLRHPCPE